MQSNWLGIVKIVSWRLNPDTAADGKKGREVGSVHKADIYFKTALSIHLLETKGKRKLRINALLHHGSKDHRKFKTFMLFLMRNSCERLQKLK